MKFEEKIKAIYMRKLGKSYGEIRKKIKISKSTLSLWLRDIQLKPEQEKRIYVEIRQKNAYRLAKDNQQKKIKITEKILAEAKKEVKYLFKDPLFLSGLMLYWAEGDKAEKWEMVKFSNSDPMMIKVIMRWFREVCKVPEGKFRIGVHMHSLHCRKNIENNTGEICRCSYEKSLFGIYTFRKYWRKCTRCKCFICDFYSNRLRYDYAHCTFSTTYHECHTLLCNSDSSR